MSAKKFIVFGKLLALLLLFSHSVAAKTTIPLNEFQDERKVTLTETGEHFHKNMLQQQVVHITTLPEHTVKLVTPGFGMLPYGESVPLSRTPAAKTHLILQDADRCESVSRFLFPYHFFW